MSIVQDHRYEYQGFAVGGATGGETSYSQVINVALGGLPEVPIVKALSTDFLSGCAAVPHQFYRVLEQGSKAFEKP